MVASRFRKLTLLAHIGSSVGWFGAVIPYVVLTITGLASRDMQTARAAYGALYVIGWYAIVPLGIAALLSGLAQSLVTQWGLVRHWWIVLKLVLTVVAVMILLRHMQHVTQLAHLPTDAMLSVDFREEFVHATGGLLVVLAAMALSVFKPWGMTAYGRRQTSRVEQLPVQSGISHRREVVFTLQPSRLRRIILYHALVIVGLFAILHVAGLHHH
jgi:hypothetical protein